MGFVVAGVVGAILGFVELQTRLRSPFTKRSGGYLVLRLVLDAGVSAVALLAVDAATTAEWTNDFLVWVAAGAAGPAAARLRFVTIGTGDDAHPVGLATFYEPVRNYLDEQIDDIGADEWSREITEEIIPRLKTQQVTPEDVADRLEIYLKQLQRMPAPKIAEEVAFIRSVVADTDASDEVKIKTLLIHASTLGAARAIRGLWR